MRGRGFAPGLRTLRHPSPAPSAARYSACLLRYSSRKVMRVWQSLVLWSRPGPCRMHPCASMGIGAWSCCWSRCRRQCVPEPMVFPGSPSPFGRPSRLPGEPAFGAEVVLTMPPRTRWAWGSLCAVGVARAASEVLVGSAHPGALRLLGTLFCLRVRRRALGGQTF